MSGALPKHAEIMRRGDAVRSWWGPVRARTVRADLLEAMVFEGSGPSIYMAILVAYGCRAREAAHCELIFFFSRESV